MGPVAGRESSVSPPFVMPWSIKFLQSEKGKARDAFFGEAQSGDTRTIQNTGAVASGNGIVLVRFYISDKTAAGYLAGDDRGTTSTLTPGTELPWPETPTRERSATQSHRAANRVGDTACGSRSSTKGSELHDGYQAQGGDLSVKYSGLNSKTMIDWGPADSRCTRVAARSMAR